MALDDYPQTPTAAGEPGQALLRQIRKALPSTVEIGHVNAIDVGKREIFTDELTIWGLDEDGAVWRLFLQLGGAFIELTHWYEGHEFAGKIEILSGDAP